jgi:hypothetical protein
LFGFYSEDGGSKILHRTESFRDNAVDLYFKGARFDSQLRHRLHQLRFFVSIHCLQVNSGAVPSLGHDHFLPNPFQFINHPTIRCYTVSKLKISPNKPRRRLFRNVGKLIWNYTASHARRQHSSQLSL